MKHIVALSGGKDSTAMALRLAESEPRDYLYVCTPTGDEPEALFEHWRTLSALLNAPLTPIVAGTLNGLIGDMHRLPNFRQRWCTRILKIEPFAKFLKANCPATSYVGIRFDEPEREAGDYSKIDGVIQDFPLRRWKWTLHDVRSYLAKREIEIPRRTDCQRCFFQRLSEWHALWRDHPEVWADCERQEAMSGATFRSKGQDSWPVALKDLGAQFEAGRVPRGAYEPMAELKCRVCRI